MCPTLQLAGGVGEGLTPQVIPITLPAVLLMRRNELGRGICLYRKVEGRGQLVRVDLLTPFSMGVQGNKQVVRFGRKYPYAELSHWSTLVSFMVCDLLSFFYQGCPCDHGFGTTLWSLMSSPLDPVGI